MALAGCGGDDESAGTTTAPQLTVPQTSTESTQPATTTTTTAPAGTTTSPSTTTTSPSTQPDTPGNDVKPSPNTPEGRFEKFCNENPGACG